MAKPPSSDSSSGPIIFMLLLAIAVGLMAMFMAGDEYGGDGVLAVLLIVFVCAVVSGGWLYCHHSNAPMILIIAFAAQCGGCVMTFQPLSCYFVRASAFDMHCCNRLRQIGLALRTYHDRFGSFPPAYLVDAHGKPTHSWRTLILPYMEGDHLYRRTAFGEPWNGPQNQHLVETDLTVFQDPLRNSRRMPRSTNYVAVVGPHTAWPGAKGSKLADFRDGPANTILLVEIADSNIHWAEPRDLMVEKFVPKINADLRWSPSSRHHTGGIRGVNVLFADGSVRYLPEDLASEKLQALLTPDGGEKVTEEECEAVFPPDNS